MSKTLPPSRPSPNDVARRLIVLKYVVVYGLSSLPRESLEMIMEGWSAETQKKFADDAKVKRNEFWQSLHKAGLWPDLSPAELAFAKTTMVTMTPEQQVNASWRVESAQVLMWALGMLVSLPPYDTLADHELLKQIPSGDLAAFISSARLRKESTIDRARDDAELWHWRSRTRQLIEMGEEFPADKKTRSMGIRTYDDVVRFTARNLAEESRLAIIDEDFAVHGKAYRELSEEEWSEVRSVTMERHFTLNWLCGYAPGNRFDETPTDT